MATGVASLRKNGRSKIFPLIVNVLEINIELGVVYYNSSKEMHAVV